MAGFKTHITCSSAIGVGLGSAAYFGLDVPLDQCLLAAALCSVSGMLPDLDSDSGVPLRESLAFGAAVVPMLLLERMKSLGMTNEMIALAAAGLYAAIRFGFGALLKRFTVHRGMFHSLPAAAIFAQTAFLMSFSTDILMRLFKAGAVLLGVLSHLVLDEIWSVQVKGARVRIKKSFGTALKLWGDNGWANLVCYGSLVVLTLLCLSEPHLVKALGIQPPLENLAENLRPASGDSPALHSPALLSSDDTPGFSPNSGQPSRMAEEPNRRPR